MPKLSIISHFYNSPEKVEQQIEHWKKIDPELLKEIEFILVDDCSEHHSTLQRGDLNLRLFRITTDIPWNQAGARNLGAYHARGEWGLFFDIDQEIILNSLPVLLINLVNFAKNTMYYLRADDIFDSLNNVTLAHHPNTYLVNMQQYRTHGMLDEDFAGHYGYEDLYMPRVWENNGCKRVLLDNPTFFKDLGFHTATFDRDLQRNKTLAHEKLISGCKNSPGILRFEWREIS
jgi:glycosyltransferase involved in cell wall biosynthesis